MRAEKTRMRHRRSLRRARRRAALAFRGALLGALAVPATVAATAAAPHVHTIWTVAGNGTGCRSAPVCGDGGPASAATIAYPQGVALDSAGNLYVVDWGDSEVRKITPSGRISVVAGDGTACLTAPACGDGGPATSAELAFPTGVAVDGHGDIFIADAGDDEIREVLPDGTITRFAGTGVDCQGAGNCGDGGPARSAQLSSPDGVAVDRSGNVFIADTGDNEIREVSRGTIATVVGDGSQCTTAPSCGDGGPAVIAQLNFPESVAVDGGGRIYIADNGDNEIRVVARGTISLLAGDGSPCAAPPACGDGGAATKAQLNVPEGVAVDGAGNVYIADWGDNEVRVVSRSGKISRVAGTGTTCAAPPACGDTGAATSAELGSPHGVAVDDAGNLYIGDTFDDEVRLIPADTAAPAFGHVSHGSLALLAFEVDRTSRAVDVRFVLSGSAGVRLWVSRGHGRMLLAARGTGAAGMGALSWNRRLGRTPAPHGTYTLTVTATVGRRTLSSAVTVRI